MYEICVTNVFHLSALGGLTPGPKFTKRGEDLADSEIYQPAKFHRSTPTHARDICYKISAYKEKNKQTVNDISTTCLSACVDKKQTSTLQNFFPLFGPWGANPGKKFTKKGEDLVAYNNYHSAIALSQPTPEISVITLPKSCGQRNKKQTSTPVVRTVVYPHMTIAVTANVYNTGRHRASGGMFITRSATIVHVCRTG